MWYLMPEADDDDDDDDAISAVLGEKVVWLGSRD